MLIAYIFSIISICYGLGSQKDEPNVVILKTVPIYFVANSNVEINIKVKNMGNQYTQALNSRPIWNVTINDISFSAQNFTLVSGAYEKLLDKLEG